MNVPWNVSACSLAALLAAPLWGWAARQSDCSRETARVVRGCALVLAAIAGAIGWRFAGDPALPAWWWAAIHTVPLTAVDLCEHRLPRWWVISLTGGGACLFAVVATVIDEPYRLLRAFLAGAGMWLLMRALEWACGGRMGGGDTRLHAVLAVHTGWVSWQTVLLGFVAGSVALGGTAGLVLLWRRGAWSSRIAAGPSLLAGAWLALVLTVP